MSDAATEPQITGDAVSRGIVVDGLPVPQATIINAGVGNLGNLQRALRFLGAETEITVEPDVVRRSRCLLLPGVGAFRPPRESLRGAMEEALQGAIDDGAWLLGICVGYQILFEGGEEFGHSDGLGLLPGTVRQLPSDIILPHMGWNALHDEADHPLLQHLPRGSFVYFVHSFAPLDIDPEVSLAKATYGRPFDAIAGRGRVLGTQFHPEKSGRHGLQLLRNYLEMARCN